jgi:hypothetical protein
MVASWWLSQLLHSGQRAKWDDLLEFPRGDQRLHVFKWCRPCDVWVAVTLSSPISGGEGPGRVLQVLCVAFLYFLIL